MVDRWRSVVLAAGTVALVAGCGGPPAVPVARPILVYSGERIDPDDQRMADVETWLLPALDQIDLDPSFLVRLGDERSASYPWDTIEISADTVSLRLSSLHPDAQSPYLIYAYLRLMQDRGELEATLPGVPETLTLEGYEAERAILSQVSDVWLLGRSSFDTQPFGPLDELVYSKEFGYLDEFAFATQGDRFPEDAAAYREANPGTEEAFRDWFETTFDAEGPQYILPPDAPTGLLEPDDDDGDPDVDDPDADLDDPR